MLSFLCDSSELLKRGLIEMQRGQLSLAREDLLAASREDPWNGYIWSALAEVYFERQEPELAGPAAEQAEKFSANNPVLSHALALYYSRAGQYGKAALAESRYAKSKPVDSLVNARTAQWFFEANDVHAGLPFAVRAAGSDASQAFQLSQALLTRGDFTDAAAVLQAGLETHAGDAQLVLALGVARYGQRRFREAIDQFLQVIRIDPEIEQPYRFLGRMLDQTGPRLAEVVSLTQAWASRHPSDAEAQLLFAKALLASGREDVRAAALLQRAIELQPDSWEAHYLLGTILENQRDYEAAAAQLAKAAELDKSQPEPHYHLARVYDRLGRAVDAANERSLHQALTTKAPGADR